MKYGPYMKRQLKDLQKSYFIFTDENGKQQRQAIAVKNIEGKNLTDGYTTEKYFFWNQVLNTSNVMLFHSVKS